MSTYVISAVSHDIFDRCVSEEVRWKCLPNPYYKDRLSSHPWVSKTASKRAHKINGHLQHRPVLWLISHSLYVSISKISHEMQWFYSRQIVLRYTTLLWVS